MTEKSKTLVSFSGCHQAEPTETNAISTDIVAQRR